MKYMLKKIIIGVAIGTLLFIIKGNLAFADTYYYNNFDHIVVDYAFDICLKQGNDFLCTDALEGTTDIRGLLNNYIIYSTKENEYLMLKKFNVHLTFKSDNTPILTNNQILLPDTKVYFNNLKYGLLNFNNTVVYSSYLKRNDTTVYEPTDNGQVLVSYGVSGSGTSTYISHPYIRTLATNIAVTDITYFLQEGYTYNGPTSIINSVPTYSSLPSRDLFINQNKNNTYLGYVEPNTTLAILRQPSSGNWNLITNASYSSWANYNHISPTEQQIADNMSSLNKEIIMSQVFLGSDEFTTEETDKVSSSLGSIIAGGSSHLQQTQFTDFLNALISKPIELMTNSANLDFYSNEGGYHLTGDLCFAPFQQGGTNRGFIPIPYKNTGNYLEDNFQMPCLTRDVYSNLHSRNFSVVGSSSIINVDSTTLAFEGGSLLSIWLLIQHGILFYLLATTFIGIVKYCIDTKDAEIEVLDL